MMKFIGKKRIASTVLAILSGALLCVGALQPWKSTIDAAGQVAVSLAQELEDEYAFGDAFTLPECTFTKDGESAKGIPSLQYPDGTQTAKDTVSLNQSGNYVLRYIATIGGKTYTWEDSFDVHGRLASYESAKTSMEYGLCTHLGANATGLTVRIANGDSLAFDHVFDMTKATMSTKLLEGFVIPNVRGTADFARMVFTFTDVEDPSVQLVFNGNFHNDSNAYGLTFFTAAGNGQLQTGLEKAGTIHVGSTLGCMVPHSFVAMDTGLYWGAQKPADAAPDAKQFCISYDAKTNQAWAGGKFISDLDDSNYYSSLWFGFPSGKAKLTISALNYNDATANMCFTSILGVDLSAKNYIDEEAPIITVDNDYEEMPSAVVGGTYPVPSATAHDRVSGACDVKVSVWHGYGSSAAKMVDVQEGRFAVDNVGAYAIVYEATDRTGNTAKEVLWVRAALSQYLPKLKISVGEFASEVEVGTLQFLPEVTVSGGCGENSVSYTLEKGGETCEIVNGTFRLESAGDWMLTCTAVDYVGNIATQKIPVKGVTSGTPILPNAPTFPSAYVSGGSYVLPLVYAYDYSDNAKTEKTCDVSVAYGGKTATYQAGDSFVPTVQNDGETLHIAYTCDGATLFECDVPVRIVITKEKIPDSTRERDAVNVERYFHTQDGLSFVNGYALDGYNGLKITATENKDSAKAYFILPQLANTFSLAFLNVPGQSKFSGLNLTLTDSENPDVSVQACLRKSEGNTQMYVGATAIDLTLDFDGGDATSYLLGYANGAFVVNASTSVAVTETQKGEPFEGFPSGKIYFELELLNAETDAAIFLHKISGINVNNTRDNTGPYLETKNEVLKTAVKDSVYTVQKVIACDVLCPNVVATLTVVSPSGEPVVSTDGVTLQEVDATRDYQIRLSEYGDYLVNIVAQESGGWKFSNKSYMEYAVTVVDGEKPTLQFHGEFQKEIHVGELLIIPEYSVSDNHTAADQISVIVMVVNAKGMPVYLYDGANAVACKYAGTYKVYFYVYDEMGNLTTFETSVTVQ